MSDSPGKFAPEDVRANEAHQTALNEQKSKHPLPDSLEYRVPPEVANRLRDPSGHSIDGNGTSTLVAKEVASLIYMDVGRWGGSAPTADDTDAHWGRHRDFGIVCGRLAALCSYTKDPTPKEQAGSEFGNVKSVESSPEFERIRPLLKQLSSNPILGRVQVTHAVLGRTLNCEIPPEDKIHVILGDLHAPVMADYRRTYSDVPVGYRGLNVVQKVPGAFFGAALQTGVIKQIPHSMHDWRGRYDRGFFARELLPMVARIFGEGAKVIVKAGSVTIEVGTTLGVGAVVNAPLATLGTGLAVAGIPATVLAEIASQTKLRAWPDPEKGDVPSVEDWFQRYHGTPAQRGADIFEESWIDLFAWLKLLKDYQKGGGSPPVRLMQLGDLFDFWIGLKCPFDLFKGAKSVGDFPNPEAARGFLKHWMGESLRNPAINLLWHFDKQAPPVATPDLQTVFLHGNHDMYMGTLFENPLKGQFADQGLVAQHGHQADAFNNESGAGAGYLLTQAAFSDNYVRTIEDPMSSLGPKLFGGLWTRLGLNEMALNACVFDRANKKDGKKPALTFVMGHTHEPVLQVIHVVERIPANPSASPPPPAAPVEAKLPSELVCKPGPGNPQCDARATISFDQVYIVDDDNWRGSEPWNIRVFARAAAGPDRGSEVTLLDEREVNSRQKVDVSGSITVAVGWGDKLELFVQGFPGRRRQYVANDPVMAQIEAIWYGMMDNITPNFLKPSAPDPKQYSMSVQVHPYTWGGTQTMACNHFKLTFSLVWNPVN